MLTAQNEQAILRQGGNWCRFAQLKRNADGTFAIGDAVDCFGDAAATHHVMGIHLKTKPSRDANGFWNFEFTIAETDVPHLNLLESAAPFTEGTTTVPDLKAEDGTQLKGGNTLDTTRPVFQFIYCASPDEEDNARVLYLVGQFERDTSIDFDPEAWSSMVFKVKAVNAKGFVCVNPAADDHLTGVAAPTLADNKAAGTWVAGT